MADVEITLPKMGESVAEATITKWLKEVGDTVEADEPLVEIATDKVDSEVPAPQDGVLKKRMCEEGDVVQVGNPIAILGAEGESADEPADDAPAEDKQPEPVTEGAPSPQPDKKPQPSPSPAMTSGGNGGPVHISRTGPSGRFYSPLVRSIAEAEGVTMQELEQIDGSGAEGRVTKKDILSYLPERDKAPAQPEAAPQAQPSTPSQPAAKEPEPKKVQLMEGDEMVEMDRMRKLIAEHMQRSKRTSPHVTSYVEADVTHLVEWRERMKKKFQEREGEKLTFTPLFIEAIVKAMKDFPGVNISVEGENIIKRKHINIGMATALPSGNLIVPVIRDADQLNLLGLAKKVNDLAGRARENKLKPEEIQGGTYTITNVGTFGNVMGTPVINQPQVGIMAVGAIRKKPAVIETPQGDFIGIRQMMYLSHSYDHRVVDGALGGQFVRRVADYLEQFDVEREL